MNGLRDQQDPAYRAKKAKIGRAVWARMRPIDRLARIATAKAAGYARGGAMADPEKLRALWRDPVYRERATTQARRTAELWRAWRQTPIGMTFTADQRSRENERRKAARRRNKRRHGYPKAFSADLKLQIRQRDGFRCQECGAPEGGVPWQCHHINYDKADNRQENLVLLCNGCHGKTNVGDKAAWQEHFEGRKGKP